MRLEEIGGTNYTIKILVSFGFQWSCPFLCTAMQGYLFCRWKSQTWGQKKTLTATSKQLFSVYLSLSVWYAWFAGTVKSIQSQWLIRKFRQLKNQFFEKKWKPGFDEISIMVILTASIRLLCSSRRIENLILLFLRRHVIYFHHAKLCKYPNILAFAKDLPFR